MFMSGPSRARNIGIEKSVGDWIAILDADDAWKPERLERLTEIGKAHNADFVADNQILFDATAKKEGRIGFVTDWKYRTLDVECLFLRDGFADAKNYFPPLKPLLRREFLTRTGVKYDESVRYGEDFKFHAEMLFNGAKAIITSEPYYIYSTRMGEFSKKPSPYSKSIPRFDLLVDMSDELKNKYRKSITPKIAAAIEKRRVQLRLVHLANVARGIRHSGKYLRYASYVLTQPDLFVFLAKKLFRRLRNRTIP